MPTRLVYVEFPLPPQPSFRLKLGAIIIRNASDIDQADVAEDVGGLPHDQTRTSVA